MLQLSKTFYFPSHHIFISFNIQIYILYLLWTIKNQNGHEKGRIRAQSGEKMQNGHEKRSFHAKTARRKLIGHEKGRMRAQSGEKMQNGHEIEWFCARSDNAVWTGGAFGATGPVLH